MKGKDEEIVGCGGIFLWLMKTARELSLPLGKRDGTKLFLLLYLSEKLEQRAKEEIPSPTLSVSSLCQENKSLRWMARVLNTTGWKEPDQANLIPLAKEVQTSSY